MQEARELLPGFQATGVLKDGKVAQQLEGEGEHFAALTTVLTSLPPEELFPYKSFFEEAFRPGRKLEYRATGIGAFFSGYFVGVAKAVPIMRTTLNDVHYYIRIAPKNVEEGVMRVQPDGSDAIETLYDQLTGRVEAYANEGVSTFQQKLLKGFFTAISGRHEQMQGNSDGSQETQPKRRWRLRR